MFIEPHLTTFPIQRNLYSICWSLQDFLMSLEKFHLRHHAPKFLTDYFRLNYFDFPKSFRKILSHFDGIRLFDFSLYFRFLRRYSKNLDVRIEQHHHHLLNILIRLHQLLLELGYFWGNLFRWPRASSETKW